MQQELEGRDAMPPSGLPLMPSPVRNTSRYICYGRVIGELEQMLALSNTDTQDRDGSARRHGTPSTSSTAPAAAAVAAALDEVTELRARVAELEAIVEEKNAEVQRLHADLDAVVATHAVQGLHLHHGRNNFGMFLD